MSIAENLARLAAFLTADTSGNLTGTTTPPQFDATKKIASMEAVQRALGNFAGYLGYTASQTLSAADAGKHVVFMGGTASQTMTLPAAAAVPAGAGFKMTNQGTVNITVSRSSSDTINYLTLGGGLTTTTLILKPGDSIFFRSDGVQYWNCVELTLSEVMPASLGASGFQKFPSGLIMQWGAITVNASGIGSATFAIPFPTTGMVAMVTDSEVSAATLCYGGATFNGTSGINVVFARGGAGANAATIMYLALGY